MLWSMLLKQSSVSSGKYNYTVNLVQVVTSIKQSPVLKGYPFLVLS